MAKLRVTLIDEVRDRRLKVDLPDDATIEKLLPALAKKLGLPPGAYRLTHEATEQALGGDQTLASFGVGEGDALRLAAAREEAPIVPWSAEEEAVPIWQKVPVWGWVAIGGVVLLIAVVGAFLAGRVSKPVPTPTVTAEAATPAAISVPTSTPLPTAAPTPTAAGPAEPGTWTKHGPSPVLDVGESGTWDESAATAGVVLFDGTTYKMWYGGWGASGADSMKTGYATSPDGFIWTKHADNPVLTGTPDRWDAAAVVGDVLFDGTTYKMWYWGMEAGLGSRYGIGYAASTDGITWTRHMDNPVLVGTPDGWDSRAFNPCVVAEGGLYKMWYTGIDEAGVWSIGYATSSDGISWTKYAGNPVLGVGPPGSWDEQQVLTPYVISDGTLYRMWYTGTDTSGRRRIGYATSPDGTVWTKHEGNPVLREGGEGWEAVRVMHAHVLLEGDTYKMWYTGEDNAGVWRIGYATAPVLR